MSKKILQDILTDKIVGVSVYPEGSGTHIQIVVDIVTGDNYEAITQALQNTGFLFIKDDGQVQSWFHPHKTPKDF